MMKVEVVQTAAGLAQAQNLRYEVYAEEMKLYGERADSRGRKLQDEHDATGIQILGTVDGRPAGTARVHAGPLPEAWSRDLDLAALAGFIPPERMAFGSGLTVLPEYRGSPLVLKLIHGVVEQAIRAGCEVLLLDCVPHLISLYQRLGWRRYTRKIVQDPATGALIPMALVLHDREHLERIRSSLLPGIKKVVPEATAPPWLPEFEALTREGFAPTPEELAPLCGKEAPPHSLLAGLSLEQVARLAEMSHLLELEPEHNFVVEGTTYRTLYMVLGGCVEVLAGGVPIRWIEPSEALGEVAWLLGTPRTANVRASLSGARLLVFDDSTLRSVMRKEPETGLIFMQNLARTVASRLSRMSNFQKVDILQSVFLLHAARQVAQADGTSDAQELSLVDQLVPREALLAADLLDEAGQPTSKFQEVVGEALLMLPLRMSREQKLALLDKLLEVALADDEFHPEEGRVLAHVARLLGLPGAEYERWLEGHGRDSASEKGLRAALAVNLLDRMAGADGLVDAREQEIRRRILPDELLRELGFLDERGQRTAALARAMREAEVELPLRLPKAEKLSFLDELFELAMADGVLHREEEWLLVEAARMLGLSGTDFDGWFRQKPGARPEGKVLSYSAGSTQTGPDGYRQLGRGPDLRLLLRRWPDLLEALGEHPPLVLNAYPAALGNFDYAVYIDTYLSPKTASRALQLAARQGQPVFLLGQPLFLAEILVQHTRQHFPLPHLLIGAVGGYPCPASLESAIRHALGSGVRFELIQGYGVAEVDAGLLFGRERTAGGEVIYEPRPDAILERSPEGRLLLGLRAADGKVLSRGFDTGDLVEELPGGRYLIRNSAERIHPSVLAAFERWSPEDWRRRTGFLAREQGFYQLREGEEPTAPEELRFHDFAGRFGMSWLAKPSWH